MSRNFTAYVYENDYKEMQKLVQQYPNIETGGDLFGLWQDKENLVIQLFIGPGKDCQRTTTSFHQDVNYLHRVGTVITTEEGLCNVGEWHSHHQIGMPRPSASDHRTVLSNMPQLGLSRFVLFIASIENSFSKREPVKRSRDIALKQIKIRPFLFREGLRRDEQAIEGKIVQIKGENPHFVKNKTKQAIERGAEPPPSQREYVGGKQDTTRKGSDTMRNESDESHFFRKESSPTDENTSPNREYAQLPSKPSPMATPAAATGSQRGTRQSQNNPSSPVNVGRISGKGHF